MANQNFTLKREHLLSLYEYRDGSLYYKKNVSHKKIGDLVGCLHPKGYYVTAIKARQYLIHRLIYMMHYGYMPQFIDHINNIKTDNRIENLRSTSISQNAQNCKTPKNNTSGIKGITKHRNKWLVRISTNNKRKIIGSFDSLELAELVSLEARNKYHKDFARLK